MKSIKQILEDIEDKRLSTYAFHSKNANRPAPISPDDIRLDFQRDRDRIIHSKAFRRLSHKTQVFISPEGDHYRTRLTHTLEVAQIARTIARSLRLNEDLVEAISLGHDVGHTPFGHIGEGILDAIYKERGLKCGFRHYIQSVRVLTRLEKGGKGLNLTYQVVEGVLKHSKGQVDVHQAFEGKDISTLEGRIVRISDSIAYINHDIDDAIRGNIISQADLPEEAVTILGKTHGERIGTIVMDIVENSYDKPDISIHDEVIDAIESLRAFLYERVYVDPRVKGESNKIEFVIRTLFDHYLTHPGENPLYKTNIDNVKDEKKLVIMVGDHIAGMTDRYALRCFDELYVPKPWMS